MKALQKNVESLQEANALTTTMLKCNNERQTNELQYTIEQMKEEKQANERLKRGSKYGRNNAMSVIASFLFERNDPKKLIDGFFSPLFVWHILHIWKTKMPAKKLVDGASLPLLMEASRTRRLQPTSVSMSLRMEAA